MKKLWITASAITWLVGASHAVAATSVVAARARSWDFSWSIYDANPNDGLAPSVSFLDPEHAWRSLAQLNLRVVDGAEIEGHSIANYVPAGSAPSDAAATIAHSAGSGGAGVRSRDGGLSASIGLIDPGLSGSSHAGISSTATDRTSPTFYNLVLGPGTGLRMSTWSQVERWITRFGSDDFAGAQVALYTQFSPPDANGLYNAAARVFSPQRVASTYAFASDFGVGGYDSSTTQLSLVFENLTSDVLVGRIRVSADANVLTDLTPTVAVPEPGSAALMLLGAAGLVCASRRRTERPVGEHGDSNERIAIRS